MKKIFNSNKLVLGYVYAAKNFNKEDLIFSRLAKQKKIELVPLNIFKQIEEDEFRSQVKKCSFVYNNSAEDCVVETLKTIEQMGKKVTDASELYYYTEDKWMFYLKCKEFGIPTPATILLSRNLVSAKTELKRFNQWPVVLKRVYGTMGEFVRIAHNLTEALQVIKRFWAIDCDKLPVIAQEFIPSSSYRVTVIDKKIVQTALKRSKNWKCTGVYGEEFEKFIIDRKLKKIINKVLDATKINICGIDFLKRGDDWVVLEVNSQPALDFIEEEHEKLVGMVLDFLKRYHLKHNKLRAKPRKTLFKVKLPKFFNFF